MGSSGKKKTTMAKLARENRLRERRLNKQAKKDARKEASSGHAEMAEAPPEAGIAHPSAEDPLAPPLAPTVHPAAADRSDDRPTVAT